MDKLARVLLWLAAFVLCRGDRGKVGVVAGRMYRVGLLAKREGEAKSI